MKQICKHCYTINNVDSNSDFFVCQSCHNKNKSIVQTNLILEKYFPIANSLLCEKTEYIKSKQLFSSLYKIQPSNLNIYFGIVFSYLYQSNYHMSLIKEANDFLINNSQNISLNKKEALTLGCFLSRYFLDIKNYSVKLESFYLEGDKVFGEKNKIYLLESVREQIIRFDEFYLKLYEELGQLSLYLKDPKETIEKDLDKNKNKNYILLKTFSYEEKCNLIKGKKLSAETNIFLNNKITLFIKNVLKAFSGGCFLVAFIFMFFLLNDELKNKYPWASIICLIFLSLFIIFFFIITKIKINKNLVKDN